MSYIYNIFLKSYVKLDAVVSSSLVLVIKGYQKAISPALPLIFGSNCGCRFTPSCSHYAIEAIQTHGSVRGSGLATRRIIKCTPFSAGGHDPVPAHKQSSQSISLTKNSFKSNITIQFFRG
jgi:uncharacterized protein